MRRRMRRLISLASALLLIVAACGGNTGNAGPADQAGQVKTIQPETTQPAIDDGDDSADSEAPGPSTATVTIGDKTFNFSNEGNGSGQCQANPSDSTFLLQMTRIDDSGAQADGSVNIIITHEGKPDSNVIGQVNKVNVGTGDGNWSASPTYAWYLLDGTLKTADPGTSQVDSVEFDGRTVRGTATFTQGSAEGEVQTMTGTFEATCGEEQ